MLLTQAAKRHRPRWSQLREMRAGAFPRGPASAAELYNWPLAMMRALLDDSEAEESQENILRLWSLTQAGVVCVTDYSGFDSPRECIRLGLEAARMLHPDKDWREVEFRRSCDVSPMCSRILCHISKQMDGGNSCVFGDILDRLPDAARDRIDATLGGLFSESSDEAAAATGSEPPGPPRESGKRRLYGDWKKKYDARKGEIYDEIEEYMKENLSWIFGVDQTSPCLVHDRCCPAHPLMATMYPEGATDSSLRGAFVTKVAVRPLSINIAGISCLPWTAEGAQQGDMSDEQLPFVTWLLERKARAKQLLEDLFFLECTPRFPIQRKVADELRDTHLVLWLHTGPEMLGWPCKRMRLFAVGLNLMTMDFQGPTSIPALQQKFEETFYKSVNIDGDALLMAPTAVRHAEYARFACQQGNHVHPENIKDFAPNDMLRMMLPAGGVARYEQWVKNIVNIPTDRDMIFFDCDHNAEWKGKAHSPGQTAGPDAPVLLRHGSLMLVNKNEPSSWTMLCGIEHLAMLGWHVLQVKGSRFSLSPLAPYLLALPPAQQKALGGNGMSLPCFGSFQFFILCQRVRETLFPSAKRDGFKSFTHRGSWCDDDDEPEVRDEGATEGISSGRDPDGLDDFE